MKNKPLVVKPIPVPLGNKHPPPPFSQLPSHEFTMGFIAPKGAGKTTTICNLLMFYKGYFNTILVFSPTIESDEKWDWIKQQELVVENKPLKRWIAAMREKKQKAGEKSNAVVDPRTAMDMGEFAAIEGIGNFDARIPEENFFTDYSDDKFQKIMEEQMNMIKLLKKHNQPKYLANRILVVFDDLVGSGLFSGSRGSYFKGINTRHRHYSASFLMVSQGYKEVPKTIRTNWSCLIVFEIGNEKEVEVIYEEYPMGLRREDWMEVYNYATKDDHSFLYLNIQAPKGLRIMKNFEQYLMVKKD